MRYFFALLIIILALAGFLFFLQKKNIAEFPTSQNSKLADLAGIFSALETGDGGTDIEPQQPLSEPPKEIKAIYLTSWSAGNPKKIAYVLNLAHSGKINAVVIDIKDYSGYVAYNITLPEVEKYAAKEIRIPRLNALIKELHDSGIYAIARITIFQDPQLAKSRPDLAIHSRKRLADQRGLNADLRGNFSLSTLWLDHKKLAWIDPAAKDAWDYNIAIAKDAASRGFDELNFDYIRFASDGNLGDMVFPTRINADLTQTNADSTSKSKVIKNFFKYLREQLPNIKTSADLFGLATVQKDDLGIGQIIEDAYEYFDYVSPMVYPSHYASGFLNYKNPAQHPYEVVRYSMDEALHKLTTYNLQQTTNNSTSTNPLSVVSGRLSVKLRPWLQDFDLGADYDATMVKYQIQAVYDAASSTPELINGWMMWNPSNVYTKTN